MNKRSITILMADDDSDDRMLTERALKKNNIVNDFRWVEDGEQLLDYLNRRGDYSDPEKSPRPGIILLDLNMPRKDGREALSEIKKNESLRRIPVVVLTTSKEEEDILRSYDLGVNSYITKPVTFQGLVDAMNTIGRYWLDIVKLPQDEDEDL